MKIKPDKIKELIALLDEMLADLDKKEEKYQELIDGVHPTYRKSARNLLHYIAFRNHDLRKLQKQLRNLGMSRFANAQGHIKASILNNQQILKSLIGEIPETVPKAGLSIKNSRRQLVNHTKELLGYRSKGRRVRIMVTMPSEAAFDYQMVHNMVANGMNCARVNCAHDDPGAWEKIINHVHKAAKALGKSVKIAMDLGGPKIRTGAITPGPKIRKFTPRRDDAGRIIEPATIYLVKEITEDTDPHSITVPFEWMKKLQVDDLLTIKDTRDKTRRLKVMECLEEEVILNCYDTSYIGTGTVIQVDREGIEDVEVGELPPIQQYLLLRVNDLVRIDKADIPGNPALYDEDGNLVRQAHISCQLKEVFSQVKIGEPILFDDGKIRGVVEQVHPEYFEVRIIRAKETGSKLKAEKGMNFPTTDMGFSGLTEKDKQDLEFVAKHADVVNFSFVNTKEDVEELLSEMERLGVKDKLSIILKIETRRAYDSLTKILLAAMQVKYVGVMIARGDLAVETGWDNIGKVQQEILSICSAAHIPVVWATQVLENLAKKGLPSRSEITDATSSLRAECVMLNKGPYINDAISLLDTILQDMERYLEKNETMLPRLKKLLD